MPSKETRNQIAAAEKGLKMHLWGAEQIKLRDSKGLDVGEEKSYRSRILNLESLENKEVIDNTAQC